MRRSELGLESKSARWKVGKIGTYLERVLDNVHGNSAAAFGTRLALDVGGVIVLLAILIVRFLVEPLPCLAALDRLT